MKTYSWDLTGNDRLRDTFVRRQKYCPCCGSSDLCDCDGSLCRTHRQCKKHSEKACSANCTHERGKGNLPPSTTYTTSGVIYEEDSEGEVAKSNEP